MYALQLQCDYAMMERVKLMAEFCLDCWNKIMDSNDPPGKYVISKELDLCEECGKRKPVIIRIKWRYTAAEWFHYKIGYISKGTKK